MILQSKHVFDSLHFELQILAYVSQVHGVILPDGLVDHETVTLDQVHLSNIFSFSFGYDVNCLLLMYLMS